MVRGVLLAVCLMALGAEARAQVPTPAVVRVPGETPGAASRNYPFFSTDIVLSNFGYVEEEFFFDGTASTYTTPELGRNAEVATRGTAYRSRLLVRRPATQARFNGVVIVEWLNVTNGYDTDVLWLYQKEFFLREGYAWVGVSAQGVGVSRPPNGLKVWSPSRYGSLNVDGTGAVTGDALGYDIYTQAGAAVKHVPAVLGGLRPQVVIAAGQSQSAGRLGPYLNAIHPLVPVYDAAMLTVNNTAIRGDLALPVIKVLSETEWAGSRSQPDTDRVRIWTVAGSTHSEQYSLLSRAAFLKRDLGLDAVDACETPARSRVEIRYVYNAAVDALVKWVRAGTAAPRAPALEFDELAAPVPIGRGGGGGRGAGRGGGAAAESGRGGGRAGAVAPDGGRGPGATTQPLKRDEFGNAQGGIRLAEIAAPVAKESAELCGLGGTHVPFDAATVNRLYPTHDDYVRKVTSASDAAVRAGFLLRADAAQTITRARRSIWGRQLTCGPLCADVAQFPKHPSAMLLANQTEFLVIKDAERTILRTADEITRLVAEGYTAASAAAASRKFLDAAARLDRYVAEVRALAGRGNMTPETRDLLVSQAAVLQGRLRAEGR
jgi:hypothetical protein